MPTNVNLDVQTEARKLAGGEPDVAGVALDITPINEKLCRAAFEQQFAYGQLDERQKFIVDCSSWRPWVVAWNAAFQTCAAQEQVLLPAFRFRRRPPTVPEH